MTVKDPEAENLNINQKLLEINNPKTMETTAVKEYINVGLMTDILVKIYEKEVQSLREDEDRTVSGQAYLDEYWDDDHIRDYAIEMAFQTNDNMKDYLNSDDHRISGNFYNIDFTYPRFRDDKPLYMGEELVEDMIKRLNDGDMSEQSVKDREYLTDWIFGAFGTFGLKYNFGNMLLEELYNIEEEDEDED